jgi:hypothetical protein
MMNNLIEQLTELFEAAGKAHHEAFIESDGGDPNWAMWYVDYLIFRLPAPLDNILDEDILADLLTRLSQEYADRKPDKPWPRYYAEVLVEQYA